MPVERAPDRIRRWRKDPVAFVREVFGVAPDLWQVRVLQAVGAGDRDKQRIGMKACKGPGKTCVLAWIIWWFMACWGERGEHPKGAATSITSDNIKANLWPELAKWMHRSEFLKAAFEWTATRIRARDHRETWFFDLRTWAKNADPQQQADTLAGLHAKFLLFVLDESGGIPSAVMATAEAGLANEHLGWAKIVQAGNPTHLEGPLWDACSTHRHLWYMVEITSDPDDPERTPRVSPEWARQQIEMYGRENPWVMVNVFGKFPPSSLNALLGPDDVNAAFRRYSALSAHLYSHMQKRLGVDVARFGDDRSVLFPRQGLAAFRPVIIRHQRTTAIAARIILAKRNWGWEQAFVDDTGHWGHGVIDNLLTAGVPAIPVVFSSPAIDPRYNNRRTEMWIEMAEWIKRGGAIPQIPELVAELTTPTYTFNKGKFVLEEKDMIKERLGRSPDLADGLALTFAIPDMPSANVPGTDVPVGALISGQGMASEYDPFEGGRI
jgi:phage terminase large subunit